MQDLEGKKVFKKEDTGSVGFLGYSINNLWRMNIKLKKEGMRIAINWSERYPTSRWWKHGRGKSWTFSAFSGP